MSKLKPEEYLNKMVMIVNPIRFKGIIGIVTQHFPIGTLDNSNDVFKVNYVDTKNSGQFRQSDLHVLTEKEILRNKI